MRQRARQFFQAGRAPEPDDFELGRQWLTPDLMALFAAQHPREIVHAAGTARWLLDRGHDEPDLIVAALLHDVAKGQQRRLDRVAWVLLAGAGLGTAVASGESRFESRRAMARSRAHAWESADRMRRAGASPRAVELARLHHRDPGEDPMLALLQQADAAS